MKKNGKTAAGSQRWKCVACGLSSTAPRSDINHRSEASWFIGWLINGNHVTDLPVSPRCFFRRTAWCWDVRVPQPQVSGEIYDQIIIDGIYLAHGWCLLIATNGARVIGWQWCNRESTAAWQALLRKFPAPLVVVTDGGPGALKAITQSWPKTRVQRCLFHVWLNTKTDLTLHPKTPAGKAILQIGRNLLNIDDPDSGLEWVNQLNQWWKIYGHLTSERTYNTDWQPGQKRWWYTHDRLRRAYRRLATLLTNNTLFAYLNPNLAGLSIARTTSSLEGGINATIRQLLRDHRGLTEPHMRTAIEWLLNQKSIDPNHPVSYLTSHYQPPRKPARKHIEEPITPSRYDTAIDYNTRYQHGSLHIRKGWARH